MTRRYSRILYTVAVTGLLTACAGGSWEQQCSERGYQKGSTEFQECVAAGNRWSSEVVQSYSGWESKAY